MDVLGYIRVSTEDQATGGHSLLLVQPERLRVWCAANGHRLVDTVIDGEGQGKEFRGVSGGLPLAKRKGGAELLSRLAAGEAQGVVVVSLTRLFRDVDDGRHFLRKVWRKEGVQLFSLGEMVDVTTAAGRFQLTMLLAAGEYERELTAERTAHVTHGLRQAGRVYGTVPFGCVAEGGRMDGDRLVDQRLCRDPQQWAVRERIVAMHACGDSLQAISNELRRQRVPAPDGGVRWSKSSISRICKTHAALAHLPHAEQPASANTAAPDAPASQESPHVRVH